MTSIREYLRRLYQPPQSLPPGIYHSQIQLDKPEGIRFHLRIEPDGNGVLIVNASTVLHLNKTATEYAYYLINKLPEEEVARKVSQRYKVSPKQALADYQDLVDRLQTLANKVDLDPEIFLDFERIEPDLKLISAPYRLDCALTYRLPEEATETITPKKRVTRELSTDEWKQVLDIAWKVGIPHVVFTGGEPTLRSDLSDLIYHAENNGQVTGLMTNGMLFKNTDELDRLLQTGLDHIVVIPDLNQEQSWSAILNILRADIYLTVHLTLTRQNQAQFIQWLEALSKEGVKAISLSTPDADLSGLLIEARNLVASKDMALVWNIPVPYSFMNPVSLETKTDTPSDIMKKPYLYVEPDGDVLPGQGVNKVLGNLLRDPWESIWQSNL